MLADLGGRAVLVPHGEEQVAAGACVQAAAALTGAEPADVADRWQLGAGDVIEPGPGAAAAADVRARATPRSVTPPIRSADTPPIGVFADIGVFRAMTPWRETLAWREILRSARLDPRGGLDRDGSRT